MSPSREDRRQLYEQLVGQTVADRYEIKSLMGFGGMGAVYEAVQRNMNRRIALKYIPSHDPVTAARFEREALTVSQLRHPNTVTVFDFGQTDDGFLFLSMELLNGRTLTDLVRQESPLAPERVVHIASQICRSLAEAHGMDIVHRDIKPDNVILIEVDGDPDVTKVLDFGIAKAIGGEDEETLTGDGRIVGTPRYMSPEQILSEQIDHRSDIYSLGCIIFEMLCGQPPFEARNTTALMISHAQDPPPPFAERLTEAQLDQIPNALEQVVRRAMAKSPWERPQTTDELREELEEALEAHKTGRVAAVKPAPPHSEFDPGALSQPASLDDTGDDSSSTQSWHQNPVVAAGAAGAAVVLLALLAGAVWLSDGDGEETDDEAETIAELSPEPPPDARPPSEREAEQPADDSIAPTVVSVTDTIHVRIDSDPSGAEIVEDEETIGETPLNFSVTEDTEELVYELHRSGYRDKEVSVVIDPDGGAKQEFDFDLQRRRPVARPAPAPAPADDDDEPAIQLLLD